MSLSSCSGAKAGYQVKGSSVVYGELVGKGLYTVQERTLEGADAETFQVVSDEFALARDAKSVYYMGRRIEKCGPDGLELLSSSLPCVFRDTQCVFYAGSLLSEDAPNFELLEQSTSGYSRDSKAVYYSGGVVEGADPQSFELLESGFARDSNAVYRGVTALPFDRASFEILNEHFSRDANRVLYGDVPVPGADPETFKVRWGMVAQDSKSVFERARRLEELDGAEYLGGSYFRTSQGIWHVEEGAQLLSDADPKSFEVYEEDDGAVRGRDKRSSYFGSSRIEN